MFLKNEKEKKKKVFIWNKRAKKFEMLLKGTPKNYIKLIFFFSLYSLLKKTEEPTYSSVF